MRLDQPARCRVCEWDIPNRNQNSVAIICGHRFHLKCLKYHEKKEFNKNRNWFTWNNTTSGMICAECESPYTYKDKWDYHYELWNHPLPAQFEAETMTKYINYDIQSTINSYLDYTTSTNICPADLTYAWEE